MTLIDNLRKAALRVEVNPTDKQKKEGNYAKGHVNFRGLRITIESPKGSVRSGRSASGVLWSSVLPDHYGYIKGTKGADKDHVDCYLGPDHSSNKVFVIDQKHHHTGNFDEHKCMLGYADIEKAKKAYRDAFSDKNDRIMHVTAMTIGRFKDWLSGKTVKPVRYFSKK